LAEAVAGLPPVRIEVRGVSPHAGGVLAFGHPVGDTLTTLQRRFARSLRTRGAAEFESWVRDRWYVSLVIVEAVPAGVGIRLNTLERSALAG
jgi:hypothetical protein